MAREAYHAGRRLSNLAGPFRHKEPALKTFLVSCLAVAHARIEAENASEAAEIWLAWRRQHSGELRVSGVPVLLRLDSRVKVSTAAGRLLGEIHRGRLFYPAGGAPDAEPVLIGGKHRR